MSVHGDASRRPAVVRGRRRAALGVVLAALGVVLLLALSHELQRRRDLYWYDVSRDYEYQFAKTQVASVPVELSDDGFVFPATTVPWDTAVLRMQVRSSWTARWFEPSITIESGHTSMWQFFERGAAGVRYLMLPPSIAGGETVRLRGNRLDWTSQAAEVLLWDNALPAAPTVLVLAPHPDDAEIAAFGVYGAHRSFVATVTAGNYVGNGYDHLAADDEAEDLLRARVRTWDSLAVPALGGVPPDRVVNLGYSGLSLERLYTERGTARGTAAGALPLGRFRQGAVRQLLGDRPAAATWESLVEDLVTLVDAARPDVVVAPHPVLDESSDHQFTTIALLEALERNPADRTILFLYTNHHILAEYYPFGPSDSHVTLPPWFDGDFPFGSVYSFDVTAERQIDKLFALEAHHDLRAAPRRLLGAPADRFVLRFWRAVRDLVRDPVADYSYFRRAVRPNELFFVYTPPARRALSAALGGGARTTRVAGQR
jgi:LmbE family N-acetylglucosaminyl deacetylase